MEKTVTISEREYRALQATAELVKHPEALVRTIVAMKDRRTVDLEEAFDHVDLVEHLKLLQSEMENLTGDKPKLKTREDFEVEME